MIAVQSVVPITKLVFEKNDAAVRSFDLAKDGLGVRPMAKAALNSTMVLSIVRVDPRQDGPARFDTLRLEPLNLTVPDALWCAATHEQETNCEVPPVEAVPASLRGTVGARVMFDPILPNTLPPVPLKRLAYEDSRKSFPVAFRHRYAAPVENGAIGTVMDAGTVARRTRLLDLLREQSPFTFNVVNLHETAQRARLCFQADPMVCALGSRDERAELRAG
jgi:hypothetical protein